MTNPTQILVTTTSTLEGGLTIKQYLKPVSAQIVAGAGFLKDFAASFTDLFGGRSDSYQRQLTAIYNEAIARLKNSAYEIGANCIVGLTIDMDEISGKGKEMFMVTALGTAVIIDGYDFESPLITTEMLESVSLEQMALMKKKKRILAAAENSTLSLDDETWDFIIANQVHEMFPYILTQFRLLIAGNSYIETINAKTLDLLNALPVEDSSRLLHNAIMDEENDVLAGKLSAIAGQLNLLDFDVVQNLLELNDFKKQKRALWLMMNNKPYYNRQDLERLRMIVSLITEKFPERGTRAMKKQMLSSKEKEVWTCECGKTNDVGVACTACTKDIYGFKSNEITAVQALTKLEERIELIAGFVE